VDGGDAAMLDPKVFFDYFNDGSEAIGGAGSIRYQLQLFRQQAMIAP
jgi:hypothetical protein